MAVTFTTTINTQYTQLVGSERVMDATIVFSGTYTTGGDTLQASALGLDVIDFFQAVVDGNGANTNGAALVAPNLGSGPGNTNVKLQLFGGAASGAALAEVSNGTTVTGLTIRARAYGIA